MNFRVSADYYNLIETYFSLIYSNVAQILSYDFFTEFNLINNQKFFAGDYSSNQSNDPALSDFKHAVRYLSVTISENISADLGYLSRFDGRAIWYNYPTIRRNLRNSVEAYCDLFNLFYVDDYYNKLKEKNDNHLYYQIKQKLNMTKATGEMEDSLYNQLKLCSREQNPYIHPNFFADILNGTETGAGENIVERVAQNAKQNLVSLMTFSCFVYTECCKLLLKNISYPGSLQIPSERELDQLFKIFEVNSNNFLAGDNILIQR